MIGNVIGKGDILNFLSNKKALSAKLLRKYPSKAQSAMEYLMTYGWAILIIAVVLGALFQLGVFNPMTFAPKAPPGSCQVFRPNGPGTTSFINLEGVCNGELPQYVGQFNGQNGYITVSAIPGLTYVHTTVLWINPATVNPSLNLYAIDMGGNNNWIQLYDAQSNGHLEVRAGSNGNCYINGLYQFNNANTWYFVAVTETNTPVLTIYVNGVLDNSGTACTTNPSAITIGEYSGGAAFFDGQIADIQIYNTSLSANEIQALYLEGIGGAPIRLQNLVGWWPLDGDANDYSGNGNNGVPTNVIFVSNWYNGYTPP